jgi:hypothetical protein
MRGKNKTNTLNRMTITGLLADYYSSGLMNRDFLSLDARDRLAIAEKLLQYSTPKLQTIAADVAATSTNVTVVDRLRSLAEEAGE